MITRWSIPVPITAIIPAIAGRLSCHPIPGIAAKPRIMKTSLNDVASIGIKMFFCRYLKNMTSATVSSAKVPAISACSLNWAPSDAGTCPEPITVTCTGSAPALRCTRSFSASAFPSSPEPVFATRPRGCHSSSSPYNTYSSLRSPARSELIGAVHTSASSSSMSSSCASGLSAAPYLTAATPNSLAPLLFSVKSMPHDPCSILGIPTAVMQSPQSTCSVVLFVVWTRISNFPGVVTRSCAVLRSVPARSTIRILDPTGVILISLRPQMFNFSFNTSFVISWVFSVTASLNTGFPRISFSIDPPTLASRSDNSLSLTIDLISYSLLSGS